MSTSLGDSSDLHAFLGACLLAAAILLPHAPAFAIAAGIGLAGVIRWTWRRYRRHFDRDEP